MERHSLIVRSIWAACLLLAGANHARILIQHGLFWEYGGVGWASAAYWSSLTILDPLAAILLFVRPRVGVPSTVLIIATNVIHNLALTARAGERIARLEFDYVVLAAGAINSPLLLKRSGLGGTQVGLNLTDHPLGMVAKIARDARQRDTMGWHPTDAGKTSRNSRTTKPVYGRHFS